MNWQPGDIAIIWRTITHPEAVGTECTILSQPFLKIGAYSKTQKLFVDVESHVPEVEIVAVACLKKLPPPNEVTSWKDCIFQPTELISS